MSDPSKELDKAFNDLMGNANPQAQSENVSTPQRDLKCEMERDCNAPVAMIDNKGYIYCAPHGLRRRSSGIPCRKLTSSEIKRLKSGLPVKKY